MVLKRFFHFKYLTKLFIFITTIPLLSACATYSSEQYELGCGPWLYGLPTSFSNYDTLSDKSNVQALKQKCALDYQHPSNSKNYPDIQPSKSKSQKQSLTDKFHQVDINIELTEQWKRVKSPLTVYPFFFINEQKRAAFALASYELNPLLIWSDNRDASYIRFMMQLDGFELGRFSEMEINGLKVSYLNYQGIDKGFAVPLSFFSAFYIYQSRTYYLAFWSYRNDFDANKKEFFDILNSIAMTGRGQY